MPSWAWGQICRHHRSCPPRSRANRVRGSKSPSCSAWSTSDGCDNLYYHNVRFQELTARYLADLTARELRDQTVRGHRSDLRQLATRLGSRRLSEGVLVEHLASLERLAPATQARHLSTLRGFLTWYDSQCGTSGDGGLAQLVSSGPTVRATAPADVNPGRARDCDLALAAIPRQADRDHLFFGLLRRLGLRPGEALALQLDDIDDDARHLEVPGRGGRRRAVLVDDRSVHLRLVNWRKLSGRHSGAVFPGDAGRENVSYQAMSKAWARHTRKAGVRARMIDLRLAHQEELLAAGLPLWVIGERLGVRNVVLNSAAPSASGDELIAAWQSTRSATDARQPTTTRAEAS